MEAYLKKPGMISLGTATTAAINLVLNFIFVKMYGYEAAAYTTMVCYMILLLFHYSMVRHYRYHEIYDNRFNLLCAFGICGFGLLMRVIYQSPLRFALLAVYVLVLLFVCYKFRQKIMDSIRSVLKK